MWKSGRRSARGRAEIFFGVKAKLLELRAKGTTRMIGALKPTSARREKASDQDADSREIITHQDRGNWQQVRRCVSREVEVVDVVMREKRRPAAARQKSPARLRHHPSCPIRNSPRSRHIKAGLAVSVHSVGRVKWLGFFLSLYYTQCIGFSLLPAVLLGRSRLGDCTCTSHAAVSSLCRLQDI